MVSVVATTTKTHLSVRVLQLLLMSELNIGYVGYQGRVTLHGLLLLLQVVVQEIWSGGRPGVVQNILVSLGMMVLDVLSHICRVRVGPHERAKLTRIMEVINHSKVTPNP